MRSKIMTVFIFLLFIALACAEPAPETLERRQYAGGVCVVLLPDDESETGDFIYMDCAVYDSLLKTHDYDEIIEWHRDRMGDNEEYKNRYVAIVAVVKTSGETYQSTTIAAPASSRSGGGSFWGGGGFKGGK